MLLLSTWMLVSEHEHDVLVSVIIGLDPDIHPLFMSYSGLTGVSRSKIMLLLSTWMLVSEHEHDSKGGIPRSSRGMTVRGGAGE